jgi:hypothetical protein
MTTTGEHSMVQGTGAENGRCVPGSSAHKVMKKSHDSMKRQARGTDWAQVGRHAPHACDLGTILGHHEHNGIGIELKFT